MKDFGYLKAPSGDGRDNGLFSLYAFYNDWADEVEKGADINDLPIPDGDKLEVLEVLKERGL